jgi:phage repressor protein C with HTH and peptisase S24 domain
MLRPLRSLRHLRRPFGPVRHHEAPDGVFCFGPHAAALPKLSDETAILDGVLAKASWRHLVSFQESFDVVEQGGHEGDNRWEFSHGQGGKFLLSPIAAPPWDKTHMAEALNIEAIRATLQKAMDRQGIKAKPLALAAGLNETAVRDVLKRSRNPGIGTLLAIADVLEVPVEEMLGNSVPLLGKVGAGGAIAFEESPDAMTVQAPPVSVGRRLMALLVAGDSMLPVYRNGDIIFVRRDHDGVLPEYLGEECAVHTADGGTWLKTLSPGTEIGRYTLRSFNAADMENVEVIWASPVLFVQRRQKGKAKKVG